MREQKSATVTERATNGRMVKEKGKLLRDIKRKII